MAQIEILLPTVQYGNVRITGTPEEFGVELSAPGAIGEMAAVYLNLFTQGFKAGAERDVDYIPTAGNESGTTDVDMTAQATIQSELGATVVSTEDVSDPSDKDLPWGGKVDAKPKPWEKKGAAPAAPAKISW